MKKRLLTILHIAVWIAGTAFLVTGAFNNNLWFDESYSVALMNHNLFDICKICAADVHPPLYYILLKVFTLIFGKSLTTMRIFSIICASLLAGLGFTHLRKDFGEKVGFWYTAIMFLFASTFKYANEIRMYTLAPLFVMLMSIYAYRFYKSGFSDKKSKALFLTFSILGAYTHYYALAAAGAVNLLLLFYCRKNQLLGLWSRMALIQGIAYIFGFFCLIYQSLKVMCGFWIELKYPDFLLQSLSFGMMGGLPDDTIKITEEIIKIYNVISLIFWGICIFFFIKHYKKQKDKANPGILVLKIIGIVIAFYFAVSLKQPVFHVRYLMVLSGLIVFFAAFAFDKINKIYIKSALVLMLAAAIIFRFPSLYDAMYSPNNEKIDTFVTENIKENDIIVSDNIVILGVLAAKYPDTKMYFYNRDCWAVEEAYKAFDPQMETVRDLSKVLEHKGRIWTLHNWDINDYIVNNTDKEVVTNYDPIVIQYHNLYFGFSLLE